MGAKRLDYLADYARHGFDVEVTCRECMRTVVFDVHELAAFFRARSVLTSIESVGAHLVCKKPPGCGAKRPRIRPTAKAPTPPEPPAPIAAPKPRAEHTPLGIDPDEWARADYYGKRRLIRRARG